MVEERINSFLGAELQPQGNNAPEQKEAPESIETHEEKKQRGKKMPANQQPQIQPVQPVQPVSVDAQIFELAKELSKNGAVEALKELFNLRNQLESERARKLFYESLRLMQSEIPPIERKRIVKNSDGSVRYRYASFEDILRVIKPILTKHGFSISFKTQMNGNQVAVRGELSHEAGHSEACEVVLPVLDAGKMNSVQMVGAILSYGKRYSLSLLLGLATEEDIDANTEEIELRDKEVITRNEKPQHVKEEIERRRLRIEAAQLLNRAYPNLKTTQREEKWQTFLMENFEVATSKALPIEKLREAVQLLRKELESSTTSNDEPLQF